MVLLEQEVDGPGYLHMVCSWLRVQNSALLEPKHYFVLVEPGRYQRNRAVVRNKRETIEKSSSPLKNRAELGAEHPSNKDSQELLHLSNIWL